MDKEATTDKIVRLIEEAAQESIDLLAFPEAYLPGYPVSTLYSTIQGYMRFLHATNGISL
jgi:predicted amidohydrolase